MKRCCKTKRKKKEKLQVMCRKYLARLSGKAKRYGLMQYIRDLSLANKRGECEAEEKDVELLARIAGDDRIQRTDIPQIFGLSYRECFDKDLFCKVRRIQNRGTYSRVSAEMRAVNYVSDNG